jgi:hypothetical protein
MVCPFFFHFGDPVSFQMSSANALEVAKFLACLLCSCRFERINPIQGVGCEFKWLISFRTE